MIADRITELRRVRAGDLRKNPKNWRRHPDSQIRAVQSVLQRIGYADALIARESQDGLALIDGHLRADLDDDQVLPVLVTDLTEEEADILLAALDPLAGMAETDADALQSLLQSLPPIGDDVDELLLELARENMFDETDEEEETPGDPPEQQQRPGRIIVTCDLEYEARIRDEIRDLLEDVEDVTVT